MSYTKLTWIKHSPAPYCDVNEAHHYNNHLLMMPINRFKSINQWRIVKLFRITFPWNWAWKSQWHKCVYIDIVHECDRQTSQCVLFHLSQCWWWIIILFDSRKNHLCICSCLYLSRINNSKKNCKYCNKQLKQHIFIPGDDGDKAQFNSAVCILMEH